MAYNDGIEHECPHDRYGMANPEKRPEIMAPVTIPPKAIERVTEGG